MKNVCRRRLAACLMVCAALWLLAVPAWAQEDRIGILKSTTGTVSINRDGERIDAEPGDPVFLSDNLMTKEASTASIVLVDGTRLSMGPESDLWLDTFAYEPQNDLLGLAVRILRGTLLFVSGEISKLAPESVKIESPSGVMGVRGTRFVVRTGR